MFYNMKYFILKVYFVRKILNTLLMAGWQMKIDTVIFLIFTVILTVRLFSIVHTIMSIAS